MVFLEFVASIILGMHVLYEDVLTLGLIIPVEISSNETTFIISCVLAALLSPMNIIYNWSGSLLVHPGSSKSTHFTVYCDGLTNLCGFCGMVVPAIIQADGSVLNTMQIWKPNTKMQQGENIEISYLFWSVVGNKEVSTFTRVGHGLVAKI